MIKIGLPGAVFIVFLVLKLTEVIDWSWWWVTAPLWISVAVGVGVVLLGLMFAFIAAILETPGEKAARKIRGLR